MPAAICTGERQSSTPDLYATPGGLRGKQVKETVKDVVSKPYRFVSHEHFGGLAKDILADREFAQPEPFNQSRSTGASMQNKDKQDQESAHPTWSVCGGKLIEILAKLQCL